MVQKFVSQHNFSIVPDVRLPRTTFSRTCTRKFTFNADYLVPFYWDEVLPGDTINLSHSVVCRMLSPLSYPIMDNIWIETFYFYVPDRLVWTNWKAFNGENKNPVSNPNPNISLYPVINAPTNGFDVGSIADYLGIPVGVPNIRIRSTWHRAYNLIYNDWFKDENLIDNAPQYDDDTNRTDADYPLRKRGKRFDYFTAALPSPQKGVAVEIPLGGVAPVAPYGNSFDTYLVAEQRVPDPYSGGTMTKTPYTMVAYNSGNAINAAHTIMHNADGRLNSATGTPSGVTGTDGIHYTNLWADLSNITAVTINSLWEAFALQKLFIRDNRGGTRYTEILRSHFGVVSPDGRLQRPEFLGHSIDRLDINTVVQNSATTTTSALGDLSAFAISAKTNHGFIRSFSEHGVILGLMNVRSDITYQRGINRAFSRRERFDFYFPELANIGEQAILNKEIYAQGTSVDDEAFGYIGRNDEYRYKPSEICGLLRSDFGNYNSLYQSLDAWHLSENFSSKPTLNKTFIESNSPIDRVEAITDLPQFICDCHFDCKHTRVMPMYNIPGKGVL